RTVRSKGRGPRRARKGRPPISRTRRHPSRSRAGGKLRTAPRPSRRSPVRVARSAFQLPAAGPSPPPRIAPKNNVNWNDYSKEMRATEWGSVVRLHGSNGDARMSPLGHKQTSPVHVAMSALLPKADKLQTSRDVRFVPKADKTRCSRIALGGVVET